MTELQTNVLYNVDILRRSVESTYRYTTNTAHHEGLAA
jgi:hypothetical protein